MSTVLKGAKLIDPDKGVVPDVTLVIHDGLIQEIGPSSDVVIPEDSVCYPVDGKFIIPGLIDTHIHLDLHGMSDTYHESLVEDKLRAIRASREMSNTVRAGVTTVRNAGSANYIDIAVRNAVDEGLVVGPRILASGKIICMMTAGNEYFQGLYREADGVDENRKAAREQLKEGANYLKVMATGAIMNPGGTPGASHLDIEEIRSVVEEGEKMGKHTAAHAHGAEGIKNAINAGVRSIEHGTLADEEALKMMVDNNIYLSSTLSSNFWMINSAHRNGIPQFMFEKAEEVAQIRQENLARAIQMGVKVIMGTDAGTPYNFHGRNCTELVQYVEKGLMNEMDAIIASTKTAAEALDLDSEIGTLKKGKSADILVLNSNPLEDIHSLCDSEEIHLIFKQGELITGDIDKQQWTSQTKMGLNG